jgi:hypothetical protein
MDAKHNVTTLARHPGMLEAQKKRAESVQNRIADDITRFAGSMAFVYSTSPCSRSGCWSSRTHPGQPSP